MDLPIPEFTGVDGAAAKDVHPPAAVTIAGNATFQILIKCPAAFGFQLCRRLCTEEAAFFKPTDLMLAIAQRFCTLTMRQAVRPFSVVETTIWPITDPDAIAFAGLELPGVSGAAIESVGAFPIIAIAFQALSGKNGSRQEAGQEEQGGKSVHGILICAFPGHERQAAPPPPKQLHDFLYNWDVYMYENYRLDVAGRGRLFGEKSRKDCPNLIYYLLLFDLLPVKEEG